MIAHFGSRGVGSGPPSASFDFSKFRSGISCTWHGLGILSGRHERTRWCRALKETRGGWMVEERSVERADAATGADGATGALQTGASAASIEEEALQHVDALYRTA